MCDSQLQVMNRLLNSFSLKRQAATTIEDYDETDDHLPTPTPLPEIPDIGLTNPKLNASPAYNSNKSWIQT